MRAEFANRKINQVGMERSAVISETFSQALDTLESIVGKEGREMALVRTNLELACFYAQRALSSRSENQL